jgi:uncharacterized coiled-coil DUF342 family protein
MKKVAYVEALKVQLREWNDRIDMLSTLAKLANLEVQTEFQVRMARVLKKRDELRDKAQELEVTGEDTWAVVKDTVEQAHRELRAEFDETKACLTV